MFKVLLRLKETVYSKETQVFDNSGLSLDDDPYSFEIAFMMLKIENNVS